MSFSILIVEDDVELRNIYHRVLEEAGYTIMEAGNGAIALELLEQQTFSLMILDMLMPTMGGDLVLQSLQDMPQHQGMKVVVISAYPHFRDVIIHFNIAAFLVKPMRPQDVLDTVHTVLND